MLEKTFAVVDLETTGNKINKDKIIQLSITFVRNLKIVDQYNTFLSDSKNISPFIRELTNISPSMLEKAPLFQDVATEINDKLKDAIFVAHNVEFDLNFLKAAFKSIGINYQPSYKLDTVELSRIFLPQVAGYQLNIVADYLNIELSQAHRADEDALATAKILIYIIEKMLKLHSQTLIHIYHLSKNMPTNLTDLLFNILSQKDETNDHQIISYNQFYIKDSKVDHKNMPPISVDELYQAYLKAANHEYRSDQHKLANLIYDSLVAGRFHAIEAYTGLGKSDAFLIAALSYYSIYKRQVIVSTSRKILQNQLIESSLTLLRSVALGAMPFVLLKGRKNYIDLEAFTSLLDLDDDNPEICFLKMRILVWLLETESGDLSELNLRGPEKSYYETMLIQVGQHKSHYYFKRALNNAKVVPVIVTNHYFLNDCLNNLEDIQALIIDEAHHLKSALDLKERRLFTYPNLKFFIGQVGHVSQDRLLASYIKRNPSPTNYLLEDIVLKLHGEIDHLFKYLTKKDIKKATDALDNMLKFTNLFLSTIRGTNDYQALYNQVAYFQSSIKELRHSLEFDNCTIKSHKNTHKTEVIIRTDELDSLSEALVTIPCQILLSGTLEVNGSFKHLSYWFGDSDFDTTIMNKKEIFDDIRLFIPNDITSYDIDDKSYVIDVLDYLLLYLTETNSKLIVIFSNFELLEKVYSYTEDIGLFEQIPVLKQSRGSNTEKLLNQYNQLNQCLLLGTYTFTEGVNLVSEKDKVLMLTKLPFPLPSGDSFRNFYKEDLPEAVIHFRQIAGRLKRSQDDKGILILFDNRILNKPYKNAFLKYFPEKNIIKADRASFKALLFDL